MELSWLDLENAEIGAARDWLAEHGGKIELCLFAPHKGDQGGDAGIGSIAFFGGPQVLDHVIETLKRLAEQCPAISAAAQEQPAEVA